MAGNKRTGMYLQRPFDGGRLQPNKVCHFACRFPPRLSRALAPALPSELNTGPAHASAGLLLMLSWRDG